MSHTCSVCQQRFGDQHLPHCQRQGLVTSASDYSDSNEGGKQEVVTAILDEREDQDRMWGGPANDNKHTGFDWVALITKQLGEAVESTFHGDAPGFRFAMVRVAALAVAAIESVRRLSRDEGDSL